ncbi:hypothetical protein [Sphingomonas sp.]|uniref:hypothetical protein n=1 Tax=Sphingomonas sp. TaxID=28214 RepID=UPI003CC50975
MTTSADQGSLADVGSPVLLQTDAVDAVRPWRWTTVTIAVTTAVLLFANAHSMGEWFDELSPNALTEAFRPAVTGWTGGAARAGFDAPRNRLHDVWTKVRAARFEKEEPGQRGAADAGE